MEQKMIILSVVVCTYNRAKVLLGCLKSLNEQTLGKSLYEVIIVNNNSTDNTRKVAEDFVKNKANFRVVIEKQQGLSYARNRGWKEARGRYVAYIDDDAVAQPNWVEQILKFIKTRPKINVFGGPYDRFSLKPLPAWFPEKSCIFNFGEKVKKLDLKNEWLSGTNMVFNKSVFKKYGDFKINLGMSGGKILYGEETEFLLRLEKGNESAYYVPSIKVKHLVPNYKFSMWWQLKNDYYHSVTMTLISKNKLNLPKGLILLISGFIMLPLCLFSKNNDPLRRRIYLGLSKIFSSLGRIAGSTRKLKLADQ